MLVTVGRLLPDPSPSLACSGESHCLCGRGGGSLGEGDPPVLRRPAGVAGVALPTRVDAQRGGVRRLAGMRVGWNAGSPPTPPALSRGNEAGGGGGGGDKADGSVLGAAPYLCLPSPAPPQLWLLTARLHAESFAPLLVSHRRRQPCCAAAGALHALRDGARGAGGGWRQRAAVSYFFLPLFKSSSSLPPGVSFFFSLGRRACVFLPVCSRGAASRGRVAVAAAGGRAAASGH